MTKHDAPAPNRLIHETSPYLLQHAYNPVDWFPWGDEAFAKARTEEKPILLSVGYAACHWCHVMERESFEDLITADIMNREFVNIKVDREERPDVDTVYMNAVQAMTGQGGWPMTVVMTPEGKPFFAGTYFPPHDAMGRPSFKRVLISLANAWRDKREDVHSSAQDITHHLSKIEQLGAKGKQVSTAEMMVAIEGGLEQLKSQFDPTYGGFGGAPKFPPHSLLGFLLRQDDADARSMAFHTLDKMALGGLYDQIGGGFSRYSVDEKWLVPHFEKMLYDNAQLVQRYSEAYQLSQSPLYARVVHETLAWVEREMLSPSGGFYSSLDADSEGVEGKFYVWDESEIDDLLGPNAPFAKAIFGIKSPGNFEGRSIPYITERLGRVAEHFELSLETLDEHMHSVKQAMFTAREARVRPGLDDKILCSWNGLMLAGFADAGRIFNHTPYIERARANAEFLLAHMFVDGQLQHTYKEASDKQAGTAKIKGLLEDYAYLGLGLLALYRATFEKRWLLQALELAQTMTEQFHDPENGCFFSTPRDGEALIVRPKEFFDSAQPGLNGAAAQLLLTLSRLLGNATYLHYAHEPLVPMWEAIKQQPSGFGSLFQVLATMLTPSQEIVIVGEAGAEDTQALIDVVNQHWLPYSVIVLSSKTDEDLQQQIPLLAGRQMIQNKATAYVCYGFSCRLPVTTPKELHHQLLTSAGTEVS